MPDCPDCLTYRETLPDDRRTVRTVSPLAEPIVSSHPAEDSSPRAASASAGGADRGDSRRAASLTDRSLDQIGEVPRSTFPLPETRLIRKYVGTLDAPDPPVCPLPYKPATGSITGVSGRTIG